MRTLLLFASVALLSCAALACGEGSISVTPAPRATAASGGASAAGRDGTAGRGGSSTAGTAGSSVSGGAGSAGSGGAGSAGSGGGVPPRRTVSVRSPYGSLAAGNLLWDGDLEWSGPWVSQYPWAATSTTAGFGASGVEFLVGPDCRSGLKCAALGQTGLAAVGVAPTTAYTHARGWVRVPKGVACGDVSVRLDGCFLDVTASAPLPAASATPDDAGWCRYEGDVETPDDAACLYFKRPAGANGVFVVDDAYVGASVATKATLGLSRAPSAAEIAEVRALQSALRSRVYRLPPPVKPLVPRLRR